MEKRMDRAMGTIPMVRLGTIAFVLLVSAALETTAAEFKLTGNMAEWSDPSAWEPAGRPGAGDTVVVDNGAPLFIDGEITVGTYRSRGPQSEQIIGRGGNRVLIIQNALESDKPRGTVRFRGHITSDGSSTLSLRVATIDARNAGRISLGEYHETQTDRALRGLQVSSTTLSAGAAIDVFVAEGVIADLGRVTFGQGGGGLFMNSGANSAREVIIRGIEGGTDAVVANSEMRANNDWQRAATTLILDVPSGVANTFSGRIIGRSGGDAVDNRIHLVKRGDGTQTLSGNNDFAGTIVVDQGTLVLDGPFTSTERLTVRDGGAIGGSGVWAGALALEKGARLQFRTGPPLRVSKRVWFDGDFGVDSLDGLDTASLQSGRYRQIDAEHLRTGPYGIRHEGRDQSFDLGDGRRAWFEAPGLTLVVE